MGGRIDEFLELTAAHQWRYVLSAENPADDVSRGVQPADLQAEHCLFTGPVFLASVSSPWPAMPLAVLKTYDASQDSEIKPFVLVMAIAVKHHPIDSIVKRISCSHRVFRITAYVRRWITNRQTSMPYGPADLYRRTGP